MAETTSRAHPVFSFRVCPEVVRLVKLDAIERGLRYHEVLRERLEESFERRPVGCSRSPGESA